MSNPPQPPPSEPPQPPQPPDPTRIDRGPGPDPTAPHSPQPPSGSPPPATPQSPPAPPHSPPGPPRSPAGPPIFKPGVATPSYAPPPPPTGVFQPPTGTFAPTSGFQPNPGYPAYQPPSVGKAPGGGPGGARSGGALLWVLIGVFAVLLCGGAGVAGVLAYRNATDDPTSGPSGAATPADPEPSRGRPTPSAEPTQTREPGGEGLITFEVTGDGPATITYRREGGGNERVRNARLPWRAEVPKPNRSFVVSLIAIRTGGGQGTLTCRVLVDGNELISRSSQRNLSTVVCVGVVPE